MNGGPAFLSAEFARQTAKKKNRKNPLQQRLEDALMKDCNVTISIAFKEGQYQCTHTIPDSMMPFYPPYDAKEKREVIIGRLQKAGYKAKRWVGRTIWISWEEKIDKAEDESKESKESKAAANKPLSNSEQRMMALTHALKTNTDVAMQRIMPTSQPHQTTYNPHPMQFHDPYGNRQPFQHNSQGSFSQVFGNPNASIYATQMHPPPYMSRPQFAHSSEANPYSGYSYYDNQVHSGEPMPASNYQPQPLGPAGRHAVPAGKHATPTRKKKNHKAVRFRQ